MGKGAGEGGGAMTTGGGQVGGGRGATACVRVVKLLPCVRVRYDSVVMHVAIDRCGCREVRVCRSSSSLSTLWFTTCTTHRLLHWTTRAHARMQYPVWKGSQQQRMHTADGHGTHVAQGNVLLDFLAGCCPAISVKTVVGS